MDFLSGEFTYMADAAMFRDCATGLRFPVAQTGDYLRTEREYTARSQGVGDPVHVRLRGHIDLMPSAEESQGLVPTLVIDSLLGFDDNQACNPGVMMVGIYVSEDGSGRSVLHLRSDYTCSFQNYGADGSAEHREGRWGLVAEEELALLLPPSTLTEQMPGLCSAMRSYSLLRCNPALTNNGCSRWFRNRAYWCVTTVPISLRYFVRSICKAIYRG